MLMMVSAVACHIATSGKEDKVIGAVPVFNHVQTFVDFPAQLKQVKITTQEDGLDGFAQFGERTIGRMLEVAARKATQG